LILEYIPGKIADSIDRLIALYRPDSLVVGTRGRKGLLVTFAGIGSISKYVLGFHVFDKDLMHLGPPGTAFSTLQYPSLSFAQNVN
jgi:hypothetical protein